MDTPEVMLTGEAIYGLAPVAQLKGVIAALPKMVKLGRIAPKSRPQTPRLESFVDLLKFTPKPSVDWYTKAAESISRMYLNDQYGDCVFAGKAHNLGIWSANDPDSFGGKTVLATDSEIKQQYFDYTGGRDNGAVIFQVLDYMTSKGFLAGGQRYKLDGYVAADWRSKELTQIGIDLFGCGSIGINLPSAWTSSAVWDVTNTRSVGGHDVSPCFTADTKVSLLDGTERTMKELADGAAGESFWVYSCDADGNVVPGRAHSARKTGENQSLVCVTLDNGERIRCTPEHQFMRRDGTYCEARDLQSGDSLMPLYRKLGTKQMKGYEQFYNPATKKWRYTHRAVAADKQGGRYERGVVHHEDFNKRNNVPENLTVMSWDDHTKLHAENSRLLNEYARSEEGRARSREVIARLWANPQWRARMVKQLGENGRKACRTRAALGRNGTQTWTPEQHTTAKKKTAAKLRGRKQPPHVNAARESGRQRWLQTPEGSAAHAANQKKATAAATEKFRREGPTDAQREARRRNMRALNAQKTANNHKVVSVESCGHEDVYDFTVDTHHNFALASGVFVHNCGYGANVLGTNADGVVIASWGRLYLITWAAWTSSRWLDELYFMVPTFLWTGLDKRAPSGVEFDKLKEALKIIGGGDVPPLPDPTPTPPPVPPTPPTPPVPVPTTINIPSLNVRIFGLSLGHTDPVTITVGEGGGTLEFDFGKWIRVFGDVGQLIADAAKQDWLAVASDVKKLLADLGYLQAQTHKAFTAEEIHLTVDPLVLIMDIATLVKCVLSKDIPGAISAGIKVLADLGISL